MIGNLLISRGILAAVSGISAIGRNTGNTETAAMINKWVFGVVDTVTPILGAVQALSKQMTALHREVMAELDHIEEKLDRNISGIESTLGSAAANDAYDNYLSAWNTDVTLPLAANGYHQVVNAYKTYLEFAGSYKTGTTVTYGGAEVIATLTMVSSAELKTLVDNIPLSSRGGILLDLFADVLGRYPADKGLVMITADGTASGKGDDQYYTEYRGVNMLNADSFAVMNVPYAKQSSTSYTVMLAGEDITYGKLTAEAGDALTVTICDADGSEVSRPYTSSVRDYAARALTSDRTTADISIMVVDMLNYGSAAQLFFGYNTEDLANNALTDEQAALASPTPTATDRNRKGENCYGSNLTLGDRILLNMFFEDLPGDTEGMYAEIRFTDHYNKQQFIRVDDSGFLEEGTTYTRIIVDDIVLADARQLVTVTVFNADGSEFGSCIDSVESYIARANANSEAELYDTILKFADSAYVHLHTN